MCEEWAHRVYILQSARLSLQSSELGPLTPGCCFPLWFGGGGGGPKRLGGGGRGDQIGQRDRHSDTLGIV